MEEDKSCYNCRYFYQHYIIHVKSIRPLECGHCSERKIKVKELSKFPFKDGCKLWALKKVNIDKRKQRLTVTLKNMAKEIHDIALILKEEELNSSE